MTSFVTEPAIETPLQSTRPRIAMVSSALPPLLDGIGDYSNRLAGEFSKWANVSLHTAGEFAPEPIEGVSILQSFNIRPRSGINQLFAALDKNPPDALILQYNPFCFGEKGFNPYLPRVIKSLKQKHPQMHLTVMVHERFMPANSPRNIIMWAYQFAQFRTITAAADLTLFSTGPWCEAYKRQHPGRQSAHMPVGSNLTFVPADRGEIRAKLNLPPEAIVLGSFGGDHPSRLFNYLAAAGRRLKSLGYDVRVLSIGSAGRTIKSQMPDLPVIDLGKLSAEDVSRNFQAIDIYCSPFFDGVSTRRGSFFAGLQHGLATVTSRAYNTDAELLTHADRAFVASGQGSEREFVEAVCVLTENPTRRNAMGEQAKTCFDANYSLTVLAPRWRKYLTAAIGLNRSRAAAKT